jgi:hypothetical protein
MPIVISDATRQAAAGYDARTWANSPVITPAQKREFEALAEEEEAEEKEDEVDQIPANVAIRRMRRLTEMDYMPSRDFQKTLAELDAQINTGPRRLAKNLEDLEDRVDAHRAQDRQTDADHDQQLEALRQEVRDLRARGCSSADVKAMLGKMWDDLHQALDEKEEERRPMTDTESANKSLTLAAASYLDANSTRADATKVVSWLVKSFGRRGGQNIKYNRELAGRLLLSKSISAQEHENWKRYDRLPDDVTLQSAGRAQPQADRAMLNAYALASMNLSPLAVQHLLMRRR